MLIKTDTNRVPILAEDHHQSQQHQNVQRQSDHERREMATVAAAGDGMDVTNPGARMGRPMSAWSIREKLQKIREFLVFERSNSTPTQTGIYIRAPRYDPQLYKGHLMFVCGMESGIRNGAEYMIPEFSIKVPKLIAIPDPEAPGGQRMIPTMDCEIRGWRSVLAALLKWGIISAHDIEKHFQVSLGRDSQHWQELLDPQIEITTQEIYGRTEGQPSDSHIDDGIPNGDVHEGHSGSQEAGCENAAVAGGSRSESAGEYKTDDCRSECGEIGNRDAAGQL